MSTPTGRSRANPRAEAPAAPGSLRSPLVRALLLLTLTTGLVDAASYLSLGHVFAANMTGNVVLLGFGIAGAGGLPIVAPIVSLGAFLVGAAAGGRLAVRVAANRRLHLLVTLLIEAALVLIAVVVSVAAPVRAAQFGGDVVIALLALAMGVRNATVRKFAVPDLTTTVLTMTLTGLAAESTAGGGSGAGSARRTAAVAAMLIGAVIGGLLSKVSLTLVLVVAAVLAVATLGLYGVLAGAEGAGTSSIRPR